MSDPPKSRLLFIPPPLAFVLAFLAGFLLDRAVPARLSSPLAAIVTVLGAAAVAASLGLAIAAVALFTRHHTTFVPFAKPSRLVEAGPYRLTRNPMYVGLTLLFLGLALLLPSFWSLLFLPLPLLLLQCVVIPFEEARLRATFGATYEAYCARVGRWLPGTRPRSG